MSRFKGWTAYAIEKIELLPKTNTNMQTNYANKNVQEICKQYPDYVGQIKQAIEGSLGFKCEREYKFLHDRRFRFDLAIPEKMIAIEFEGGIWTRGRHVRGKGYVNDVKKYNLATMHGWKLLRYTIEDTKKINWELGVLEEVKKILS